MAKLWPQGKSMIILVAHYYSYIFDFVKIIRVNSPTKTDIKKAISWSTDTNCHYVNPCIRRGSFGNCTCVKIIVKDESLISLRIIRYN